MKSDLLRLLAAALLALGLAAGCASTEDGPATEDSDKSSEQVAAEQAIADAKAANKEATAVGFEWRDTGKIIASAEEALAAGDYAKAKSLADQAKAQAEAAVNQYYLEEAKAKRAAFAAAGMSDAQLADLDAAIASGNGANAYAVASQMESSAASERMAYTVMSGDSLWTIAGKSSVYGNAYQWPLIYKANSGSIKDADLIYPGQSLSIDKSPSSAAVRAAVQHAKTRGAWSVGAVEESDKSYLAQ